jgi:WD40 repeat protein
MFYASSTTGDIMIFDVRNGNKIRTYRGHAAPINDFIEVVQHKVIVTAGDDFVCNVYDLTKEPKKIEKKLEMNKELS